MISQKTPKAAPYQIYARPLPAADFEARIIKNLPAEKQ